MRKIVHVIEEETKDAHSMFEDGYEHGYYKAMMELRGHNDSYIPAKQGYKI
jgi:hypothetical protein